MIVEPLKPDDGVDLSTPPITLHEGELPQLAGEVVRETKTPMPPIDDIVEC